MKHEIFKNKLFHTNLVSFSDSITTPVDNEDAVGVIHFEFSEV